MHPCVQEAGVVSCGILQAGCSTASASYHTMPAVLAGIIGPNGLPLSDKSVPSLSYSKASEMRPKGDVLQLLKNKKIPNEKYIDALLEKVNASEITHLLKISKNRLCVYVTTAAKATKLFDVCNHLIFDCEEVKLTYLVPKSVKVIISNATN